MKLTSAAKVGFTVILVGLVLVGIFRGLGQRIPWLGTGKAGTYVIYAKFISVKGLKPGADVQLNGNAIGEVAKIENDDFGNVVATLEIHNNRIIHERAAITISRDNIFGNYLVMIDEPRSNGAADILSTNVATVKAETGSAEEGGALIHYAQKYVAGVVTLVPREIGKVMSIAQSDQSDLVLVRVDEGVQLDTKMAFIPFRPSPNALLGFEVRNVIPPGATIEGIREKGPEDLVVDADKALTDISNQAVQVMGQVATLLGEVGGLINKEQIQKLVDTLSSETTLIANNVARLTTNLNTMLSENQPYINKTMQNVEGATSGANQLMADLNKYNTPEMKQKIDNITTNLADATTTLTKILQDLEGLTSDQQMTSDLKATITQAHATLAEAQGTLEKASHAIDQASSNVAVLGGIEATGSFTLRYAPDPDRWVGDLETEVGMKNHNTFLAAGVNDIGEQQRLNAQIGWRLRHGLSGRVGIHRGKIGVGGDWRNNPFGLSTDVYDPNDLTWDIYGNYVIVPQLGLVIGIEDLLGSDEANLGLRFQF